MKTIMVRDQKFRGTKVKVNGTIYPIHGQTGYLIVKDADADQLLLNTNKYVSVEKGDLIARVEHTRFEAEQTEKAAAKAKQTAKDAQDALDQANAMDEDAQEAAEVAGQAARDAQADAGKASEEAATSPQESEPPVEPPLPPSEPIDPETPADEPEDAEIVEDAGTPEDGEEEPWPEVDEDTPRDVMVQTLARLGVEHTPKANKTTLLDLIIEAYGKAEEE